MSVPPRSAFAAAVREIIEQHDEWDSLHHFITLHWEDEQLRYGTYAAIDPHIRPRAYPRMMAGLAKESLERTPDRPPYGYLLQIEAWTVTEPGPRATPEETEQFRRDYLGQRFHQRPDRIEGAVAWAADIHGRVWSSAKHRASGKTEEHFWPPGRAPRDLMIDGLLAVAYTTGITAWGLPGPQGSLN